MTKRAAIYARISKADKKVPKVENQIAICRALAEDNGYEIVDDSYVFSDDGIAASGKAIDDTTLENRPGALALLSAMRAGKIDVLLAVEGERLARTYLDGLKFIEASSTGGVTWHLDTDGQLDPASPAGEETAVGIFASGRREGRVRSSRQKRRYDAERALGLPLWGPRPFGYEEDRITLRASEADRIRDAVVDYLEGDRSLIRIARDWTEAGVLTDGMQRERKGRDGIVRPARQTWTATTVRQVLLRDRNAGVLSHDGATMPKSQIEAIITTEQLAALKAGVKTGTPMGARAKSLMGGIVRCACGAPMHGTTMYSQRKGGPRNVYQIYKCSQYIYDKTQKHSAISQKLIDDLLTAFILKDLYEGTVGAPSTSIRAELGTISASLTANAEAIEHTSGLLLDVTLKSLHATARGQLKVLEVERLNLEAERDGLLARADQTGALAAFMGEWRADPTAGYTTEEARLEGEAALMAAWESIGIERQRVLVRARYRPVVKPGGRGIERIRVNPITATV